MPQAPIDAWIWRYCKQDYIMVLYNQTFSPIVHGGFNSVHCLLHEFKPAWLLIKAIFKNLNIFIVLIDP